jgi:hypothetical protein
MAVWSRCASVNQSADRDDKEEEGVEMDGRNDFIEHDKGRLRLIFYQVCMLSSYQATRLTRLTRLTMLRGLPYPKCTE